MSNGGRKMKKIGDFVCEHKWFIVITTIILMIPALLGYILTDINYDILVYLPSDIETLKGEHILTDDFHMGAFSIVVVEDMSPQEILKLEEDFKKIESVGHVASIHDITGTTIPLEMLPNDLISKVVNENSELVLVTFENSTSDDETLKAVEEMRNITEENVKIGGMSAMVLDTKELFNSEMLLYVVIAALLCILVLELSLDSYLVPLLLMANIGIAILFNMGSNIIFGEISYITKAIAAVLQLGVTTDFSIFLYHKYEKAKKEFKDKEEAMEHAIHDTLVSVFGSSLTTIAGFLALCTMNLTLGVDIGLVMAKGVLIGVICVITVFPALLLVFDKQVEKTIHKELLPKFTGIKNFVMKHYIAIFTVFIILLIPAYFAQRKTPVYYKLDKSIPENYGYTIATKTLKEDFGMVSQEMVLVRKDMEDYKINDMVENIKNVDGIDLVINPSSLSSLGITDGMIPESIRSIYETDDYKMIIIASQYDIATNELNDQIEEVNKIIKSYDEDAILAGEGALMKDLVVTTDEDFHNVNYASIGVIFILMMIVLKSISLPVLLVTAIEFAIFINMGVPYFTGTEIPFIASVVIGTIQLGATIDYAILMTTKYLEERKKGHSKKEAVRTSLDNSINSIFVSAMCFFGATIGVGVVSKIDMIGSLCTLIARGAIVSMIVVMMIVPSILIIFDSLIMKTTLGMKTKKYNKEGMKPMKNKKIKKTVAATLLVTTMMMPLSTFALTKEETVYTKLNGDGSVKNIIVNEHLLNRDHLDEIKDITDLENILNINSNHKFTKNEKMLTWESKGKDIFYQGTTNKETPITEKISYKLDGKDIKLEELIGKCGNVEIKIEYQNKDKHVVNGNTLYTPFVVATASIIPSENNSDIEVTNGKVIDNGKGYIVVGLSTPGLYESLTIDELEGLDTVTISYHTEHFELSSIYSVATPKVIDSSDLNIFDKLDSLSSSINTLQDSMNQIENGSKTVLNGLNTVSDGSMQIASNLNVVNEKLGELQSGATQIDQAISLLLSKIPESMLDLAASQEKVNQLTQLIAGTDSTIATLNGLCEQLSNAYTAYNLSALTYDQILASPSPDKMTLYQVKYNYENSYATYQQLIGLLNLNKQALESSLNTLNASSELTNALPQIKQLKQGTTQLVGGTSALKEGVNVLSSKMNELSAGTNELKEGMTTLNTGIETFNREGVQKLSNIASTVNRLSDKVEGLSKLSNEYQTFDSKGDEVEGNTKFVLVVDSVKAPKKEKKVVKEEKKETVVDRIKNLFK